MRNLIDGLGSEWRLVEQQIDELNDELELCCPAATSTDPQQRNGAEKAPSAWKRYALPLSRTTTTA
jgi:hypothetical protein